MNWTAQTSGTIVDLNGVSFVDPKHGWVVGRGGVVLHTVNGGASWTPQDSHTTLELQKVCFPTPAFGCAVGVNGAILTTTDGGQNWQFTLYPTRENLADVHFVDSLYGWACGVHGTLLATTDGGLTWLPQSCPITDGVSAIYFVDRSYGWASGSGGAIIATGDGGQTWSAQASVSVQPTLAIHFADRQRGFTVDLTGAIWATANGGQQWHLSRSPASGTEVLLALDRVGSHGWCAVGGAGVVVSSDNDGASWNTGNGGCATELRDVAFAGPDHGWAVGRGGTILCSEKRLSVSVAGWTHDVAIDPMALLLPNSIYVKWVEGHHPHTPEQLERFVRGLQPVERQVVSRRAAELRDLTTEVERVAAEAVGETRGE